jgi:pimeloyl-ACP methyl ester carboxylesterase
MSSRMADSAAGPAGLVLLARDALAIMDARGVDRFHVVGSSIGGLIAIEMALIAPHRVRSLSLLATFASGARAARWSRSFAGLRSRIRTRRMRRHAGLDLLVSRSMRKTAPRELLAEYMRLVLGRDLADLRGVMDRQLRAVADYDPSDRLSRLAGIPTLVVSAAEDGIASPRGAKALAAAIPGAHYLEIPEAAHGMAIQYARVVNRLLAEHFLAADRPRLLLAAS